MLGGVMEAEEREFFRTVREAIFSNPFGTTRPELDRMATGLASPIPLVEVLPKLIEKAGRITREVEVREGGGLSAEDTLLLQYGKLFYTFHIFCNDYDAHIQEQMSKGDECCPVPFAADVLKMLSGFGFGDGDAVRFIGLFFQMRRAYFFIRSIVGKSTGVINLRRALWNNIFTGDIALYNQYLWDRMEDFSTMILGETGTGKGMAAAAIGRSGFIPFNAKTKRFSESFARAFIPINLSQYPEQLIESELFGHKKGAFTGAIDAHHGVFSRCSPCGAIFLDEIGDVEIPIQIKLLQVLQSRIFSPVGSHATEKFQGRVIAATNKNLNQLREKGDFRDDFYYRLCSDVIEVPPLRQRLDENPDELKELLAVTVRRIIGKESVSLTDEVHGFIESNQPANYPWPGNIRELEQCVRRILLNSAYLWQSQPSDKDSADMMMLEMKDGALTAQELLARYCTLLYRKHRTYEAVARLTQLDRRTVKKYIESAV
jgi:hypothetical protein